MPDLNLADHFAARGVGRKDLGEKRPEGYTHGVRTLAAVGLRLGRGQHARGNPRRT